MMVNEVKSSDAARISDATLKAATISNEAEHSKFLSIPPELRNNIYYEVFVMEEDVEIPKPGNVARPGPSQSLQADYKSE